MSAQPEEGWIPEDSLADRLFLVRRKLGLSQREAAMQTGIPYGSWQSMEDGRQARAVDVKVAQISAALGVDRNWLMWGGVRPPQTAMGRTPEGMRPGTKLPRLDSNQQPAGFEDRQLGSVYWLPPLPSRRRSAGRPERRRHLRPLPSRRRLAPAGQAGESTSTERIGA